MIVGVIPARGSSRGLPRKNVRLLAGIPLIAHTIRAARASALLSDVLVSTDDPAIAEIARAEGAPVPFLRPPELAGDDVSVWPVTRHAVEHWERARAVRAEAVAVLQPTTPLRTGLDIDAAIERFRALAADLCVSVAAAHDSPYFNMVEVIPERAPFARACSAAMLEHLRRQDAPTVYALNGGVYVVRRSVLDALENQFSVARLAVSEMPRTRSVDIDTAEDLELAEWLLSRGKAGS